MHLSRAELARGEADTPRGGSANAALPPTGIQTRGASRGRPKGSHAAARRALAAHLPPSSARPSGASCRAPAAPPRPPPASRLRPWAAEGRPAAFKKRGLPWPAPSPRRGPRARPAPAPCPPRVPRTPLRAAAAGAGRGESRPVLPIRASPASAGNPAAAWHRHKRGRRRRRRGEVPGGRWRAARPGTAGRGWDGMGPGRRRAACARPGGLLRKGRGCKGCLASDQGKNMPRGGWGRTPQWYPAAEQGAVAIN